MKKNKVLSSFFVCVLVVSAACAFWHRPVTPVPNRVQIESPVKTFYVEQKISYNSKKESTESINVKEGESVLDVLVKTKNPQIKEYSFGKAVESIDGIKNGDDKKYWLYSVNGKEANVGAADYKLASNDIITWEFK